MQPQVELETQVHEVFTITKRALPLSTRSKGAFSVIVKKLRECLFPALESSETVMNT